jgi:ankyrin repeat protein
VHNRAENDGVTPFITACQLGHLDMVRCLANELNADVHQARDDGATPLFMAAQGGHFAVVRFLVEVLGADVSRMAGEQTPLMAASCSKNKKIIKFLIKHGADAQVSHQEFGTAADVSKEFVPGRANRVPESKSSMLESWLRRCGAA